MTYLKCIECIRRYHDGEACSPAVDRKTRKNKIGKCCQCGAKDVELYGRAEGKRTFDVDVTDVGPIGAPVSIDTSTSTTDTDALALALIEEQKKNVGATFGYCACTRAVSASGVRKAKASGRSPRCTVCARADRFPTDDIVYLCSQHRGPLPDHLIGVARRRSRRGIATTCGAPECVAAQRRENGRKTAAAMTPAQRLESARKAVAASAAKVTPAQRRESGRKAAAATNAKMTPAQRSERSRNAASAAYAASTPAQRSEKGRKAAEARWRKAATS